MLKSTVAAAVEACLGLQPRDGEGSNHDPTTPIGHRHLACQHAGIKAEQLPAGQHVRETRQGAQCRVRRTLGRS